MAVKIITGTIGSGKTAYCLNEIDKIHYAYPERRCVMLVPANYTHVTEKLFADKFGGTGLNNIEVTSIEKLMREMLFETEKVLAAPGRFALIKKAIKESYNEIKESTDYSARLHRTIAKKGFIDVANSFIEDIKRYRVNSDDMLALAEKTDDDVLKQKLSAAVKIYKKYNAFLEESDYIDSDEMLVRLAGTIKNKFGKDTSVWIDKFDEFIPDQLSVIFALIDCGADITITFNITPDEKNTFCGTDDTIRKICEYTDVRIQRLKEKKSTDAKSAGLEFLSEHWFSGSIYSDTVDDVELFEAREIYTEIENAASRIVELVREENYRYRDISVVCGDIEAYSHLVEAVFDEYEIPYYSDARISIASHPIAVQILSVFDVIRNNFDYASMTDYMRAGFLYVKEGSRYKRISLGSIDRLENHILKYGLHGKAVWTDKEREWGDHGRFEDQAFKGIKEETSEKDKKESEKNGYTIDELRRIFVSPIESFISDTAKAKTVKDYCTAVYNFMCEINLYNGIEAEKMAMEHNNATADAQRFSQIWNMILGVLDQLYLAMGNDEVTAEDFEDYLLTAMSKCEIKTVPSGIDRVYIGASEKDIDNNVRVMFMMGAVTNTYPKISANEGFFSDADRRTLKNNDISFSPATDTVTKRKHNVVYKLINKPTDKLYISYPVQSVQGKPQRPSQLFLKVNEMLANVSVRNDITDTGAAERKQQIKRMYLSSPRVTLHRLWQNSEKLGEESSDGKNKIFSFVEEWFENSEDWKYSYSLIKNTKKYFENGREIQRITLPEHIAKGERVYDYTAVNTYIKCPFSYYMKYILKAYERQEWEFNAGDVGTYAHDLMHYLCKELDDKDLWQRAYDEIMMSDGSETIADKMLDEIVEKTVENIKVSDFKDKEKVINIVHRIKKTVKKVAAVTVECVKSGKFRTLDYEHDFNVRLTEDGKITLRGQIDRIDVCERDDNVNEYRVIDYKTGAETFSEKKLDSGVDMQLFIYAIALLLEAEQNREKLMIPDDTRADISGVYYSHMQNRLADSTSNTKVETQLKKNTGLDGMTFVDTKKTIITVNKKDTEKLAATDESVKRISSHIAVDEKGRQKPTPFFEFKNGMVLAEKRICDRSMGRYIMNHVKEKLIEADESIRAGKVDMKPYKADNNKSSCDYCPYKVVCSFDEQFKQEWEIKKTDTEARAEFEEGARRLKDEMDK